MKNTFICKDRVYCVKLPPMTGSTMLCLCQPRHTRMNNVLHCRTLTPRPSLGDGDLSASPDSSGSTIVYVVLCAARGLC